MTRPVTGRTTLVRLCLSLLLVLAIPACSDSPEPRADSGSPSPEPSASQTAEPVQTRTQLGQVVGRLPRAHRVAVRKRVTAVVDGWWEAAYLGGDYPRTKFTHTFPRFSPRAAARARQDKGLLTNAAMGPHVDSITAVKRVVVLDVVAAGGRPRGVTARFQLRFRTTGDRAGVTTVRGRLFLSPASGTWQVFGYDVSRQVRA